MSEEPPGGWDRPPPQATSELAVKRSLGRTWVFFLISGGLYAYFWFYVNRQQLDLELADGRDDALLHTAMLSIPGLNVAIVHWLWRDLNELRARVGLPRFPEIAYLIGSILLAPLFYSLVLGRLNEYWDVSTGGRAVDAPVTTVEKVVLLVGAAFLLVVLALVVLIVLVIVGTSLAS